MPRLELSLQYIVYNSSQSMALVSLNRQIALRVILTCRNGFLVIATSYARSKLKRTKLQTFILVKLELSLWSLVILCGIYNPPRNPSWSIFRFKMDVSL